MTLYLLDTDISSYIIRRHPPELLTVLEAKAVAGDQIVVSVITYAELAQGLAASPNRSKHEPAVRCFLQRLHAVLDWDKAAADHWAEIHTHLKRSGTPIGNNDPLIAAHARSLGAILVTNNDRHFSRVPGLRMENWATG